MCSRDISTSLQYLSQRTSHNACDVLVYGECSHVKGSLQDVLLALAPASVPPYLDTCCVSLLLVNNYSSVITDSVFEMNVIGRVCLLFTTADHSVAPNRGGRNPILNLLFVYFCLCLETAEASLFG